MNSHAPAKTFPASLVGGPLDGLAIDVARNCKEVRPLTPGGSAVKYVRLDERRFGFAGYVQ